MALVPETRGQLGVDLQAVVVRGQLQGERGAGLLLKALVSIQHLGGDGRERTQLQGSQGHHKPIPIESLLQNFGSKFPSHQLDLI